MSMPRADEATRAFFETLIPTDPRVTLRPMFGNLAGFVNGNMFAGVFGSGVFVRLSEEDRGTLLEIPGAEPFEPMKGKPMREYVVLPEEWRDKPEEARAWVLRAIDSTGALPPKEHKDAKAAKLGR